MSNNTATLAPDFDSKAFVPATYNHTYYDEVMEDEAALITWQATTLDATIREHLADQGIEQFSHQWEAGSGPAVHHLFALEKYSKQIQLSDYLPDNLNEIKKWVAHDPAAHDWHPFVSEILKAEGVVVSEQAIADREQAVRSKIAGYHPLDLKEMTADMQAYSAPFVTSFFVADSATADRQAFIDMTKNAFSIVEQGGLFVGAYLGGCKYYMVGHNAVVSADIQYDDLVAAFEACNATDVRIERFDTPTLAAEGFDHIFTVTAKAQ